VQDADALLSGDEGPACILNVEAVAQEAARISMMKKQEATVTSKKGEKNKEDKTETKSDSEEPVSKKSKSSKGKASVRGGREGRDSRVSAGKGKGKKEEVNVDASGD
jgi:hypothetical protein